VKRKLNHMVAGGTVSWLSRLLRHQKLLLVLAIVTHIAGLRSGDEYFVFWHLGPWTAFGIGCLLATWAPAIPKLMRLTTDDAWRLAAVGCGGLLFHWYFLVSPFIGSSGGFFMTFSLLCALGATYFAPGSKYMSPEAQVETITEPIDSTKEA
jgi:hypothetical protein